MAKSLRHFELKICKSGPRGGIGEKIVPGTWEVTSFLRILLELSGWAVENRGMDLDTVLLLGHVAATWLMIGIVWFVQIVHYPLFAQVGRDCFDEYERRNTRRTGFVVGVPLLTELALALIIVWRIGGTLSWIGLVLVLGAWGATALWQIPAHRRLESGFDSVTLRHLLRTNWVRTFCWSVRGFIALAILVGGDRTPTDYLG